MKQINTYIIFACHEKGGSAEQLQFFFLHNQFAQINVYNFHGQIECLVIQFECLLHFDHPIDQQCAHPRCQLWLPLHVRFNFEHLFASLQVVEDVHGVLGRLQRIIPILAIKIDNTVWHRRWIAGHWLKLFDQSNVHLRRCNARLWCTLIGNGVHWIGRIG